MGCTREGGSRIERCPTDTVVVSLRYSLDHGVERHRDALPWCAQMQSGFISSADRQEGYLFGTICRSRGKDAGAEGLLKGQQRFFEPQPFAPQELPHPCPATPSPRGRPVPPSSICSGRRGVFLIRSSMNAQCGSSTLLRWSPILQELQIRSSDSASTTSPPTTPLCRITPRPIGSSRRPRSLPEHAHAVRSTGSRHPMLASSPAQHPESQPKLKSSRESLPIQSNADCLNNRTTVRTVADSPSGILPNAHSYSEVKIRRYPGSSDASKC